MDFFFATRAFQRDARGEPRPRDPEDHERKRNFGETAGSSSFRASPSVMGESTPGGDISIRLVPRLGEEDVDGPLPPPSELDRPSIVGGVPQLTVLQVLIRRDLQFCRSSSVLHLT